MKEREGLPHGQVYVQLKLCDHIYPVEYFDKYMKFRSTEICPRSCPESSCFGKIYSSSRYGNAMKRSIKRFADVSAIVQKMDAVDEAKRWVLVIRDLSSYSITEQFDITNLVKLLVAMEDSQSISKDVFQAAHLFYKSSDAMSFVKSTTTEVELLNFLSIFLKVICPNQDASSIKLSEQLVHDFKSEMYRLFLSACCNKARTQCSQLLDAGFELCITRLEKFLKKSKDDHFERVSQQDFDRYFKSIRQILPNDIKDITCELFLSTKHQFYKCSEGHYYWRLPVSAVSNSSCTMCKTKM